MDSRGYSTGGNDVTVQPPAPAPGESDHEAAVRHIEYVTNTYTDDSDTVVDNSVSQNIWADGDVNQDFDNDPVTASGDGSVAAGDDVRGDVATGELLEAVAFADRAARPLPPAAAREQAGLVCAENGRIEDGTRLLLEARDGYLRLGARRDADRTDAELRRLGVRRGVKGTRDRPRSGWASLTTREREVAELVSEGLTNRQIGERLLSPRTVGTHISHILAKLGLRSRVELAVGTRRRAAPPPRLRG